MKKTIKQSIKNKLDKDIFFILFRSVNLSSIKANLKTDGFKRIPNEKRLKSIIKKLYNKSTVGKIGFTNSPRIWS